MKYKRCKSSSVVNLVYSYKANQTRFECSVLFPCSFQRGFFFFRFLSLFLRRSYLRRLEATRGKQRFVCFSALSYYKSSVETNFSIFAILRSWQDFARECICFGCEAENASGEACPNSPPAQIRGVF